MDARLLARREAHFHDLVEALAGQAFGDLCAEHIAVVASSKSSAIMPGTEWTIRSINSWGRAL
jgi:hypothetical protein